MGEVGTPEQPLRVAIIGSGPSGFYTAQHLLAKDTVSVEVDIFDRLVTPFGLIRYGVAPDHQKVKSVAKAYTRTAAHPGFRYFGNVELGRDVTVEELRRHYHQIVYATGAQTDRQLGIDGEDLPGSHPATEFVAWYNGHPDFKDCSFDLSHERAIVVGVGNVAIDVARILCLTDAELRRTDMANHAIEALAESRVREVVLLGRRGPAQAAFTNTEIKELAKLEGANPVTLSDEMELDTVTREELAESGTKATLQKIELLQNYVAPIETPRERRLVIRFLVSPTEILGGERVEGVRIVRNELYRDDRGSIRPRSTDRHEELEAGIVFRSVGYRGVALPGVPFRQDWGTIPHELGRVLESPGGPPVSGEYVSGWIKRGPSGVIGTNKPDALETVKCMFEDLAGGTVLTPQTPSRPGIDELLAQRAVRTLDFASWQKLDAIEVSQGAREERPRVKLITADEMFAALDDAEEEHLDNEAETG